MSNIKYRLKGHESFIPREGWIAKGLEQVSLNPQVFASRNYYGADSLGVGANMAKSIRYWMNVMGLSDRDKEGEHLTHLGQMVYDNDPFIEDDFTLWLLHYKLICDKERATSWNLFFQNESDAEYTKEGIYNYLQMQLEQEFMVEQFAEKSLRDDVTALIAMYCRQQQIGKEIDPEEKSICPFTRLGLLRKEATHYIGSEPNYMNISPFVVLLAISHHLQIQKNEKKELSYTGSMSIESLLHGEGGVKPAFHISRIRLNDYLDQLESQNYIKVNRTAGLDMIYETEKTPKSIEGVTRIYFEE